MEISVRILEPLRRKMSQRIPEMITAARDGSTGTATVSRTARLPRTAASACRLIRHIRQFPIKNVYANV